MSFSRRNFLRTGTLAAISVGIPLRTLVAETLNQPSFAPGTGSHLNGFQLTREAFSRHLNSTFFFTNKEAVRAMKLIEVNDLTPKANRWSRASGKECFGVVFIGSCDEPVRQETYTVTHASLGKFDMLVVPMGKKKEGVYYEAIFNRLH